MQAASIRSPMRAAVLGGRFPSVGSFPCSTTAFYPHSQPIKQHARLSSVAAMRTTRLPRCRPQPTIALPAPRTASIRSNSTAPNTPRTDAPPLDWNSFFRLRASRRRYSLGSSILTSGATTVVGVQFIATQDLESLGVQVMGLDPIVVLGMATAACGAVGWLLGPFLGNGLWGLVNRRNKMSVLIKEKEFFDRIRRFRVDPSSNSIANPVPDYYGEKIGSVQGYRQWLKDQRAYNRKRRNFIS
ncbi:hypothetical protein PHISP_00494 [Aspergillus sp. HF37]|nr:hypothetical protein PHISP_00494 [Aspergillus sp. HF37]